MTTKAEETLWCSARRLTLYVRKGCTLCEDMHEDLLGLSEELRFSLDLVDIDADPVLRGLYDTLVPVLAYGEQQICHYFLDPVALRSALAPE